MGVFPGVVLMAIGAGLFGSMLGIGGGVMLAPVISKGCWVLLRVASSLILFVRERDWRYVLVAAGVCGIIAVSAVAGRL